MSWALVALSGCSDDGLSPQGGGTGAATADGAGTTASVSTTVTASAGPDDGATSAAAGTAGDGTSSPTASADDGTAVGSGPADEDGSTAGLSSTAGDTSTGGDAGPTGGDTGTTGADPGMACEVDADCVVVNDCCSCTAAHAEDMIDACPVKCDQTACDAAGLAGIEAQCVFGSCELVPVPCNDAGVFCDDPQPDCPDGTLPSVTEDGNCWTGNCVPAEACDVVPDCTWCSDADTCVQTATQLGFFYACWPTNLECAAGPSCDCMGEVCTDPFICSDPAAGPAELGCVCPVCG